MLDDILELIIEIVLDGAIEAAGSKKKAILIGLSALVWLAVIALFLWIGIAEHDSRLVMLAIALFAFLVIWVLLKGNHYRIKRK